MPIGIRFPEAGGLPVSVEPKVLKYGASNKVVISFNKDLGTKSAMAPIRPIDFGLTFNNFN